MPRYVFLILERRQTCHRSSGALGAHSTEGMLVWDPRPQADFPAALRGTEQAYRSEAQSTELTCKSNTLSR